MAEKEYLIHC